MATLNGSDLMVFVTVGGKLKSIAYATSHQMNVNMNTKDTSTKDNGNGMWENAEAGLMSWDMSSNNLMSDSAENGASANDLMEIFLSRTPVEIAFSLQTNNIDYTKKLADVFEAPEGGWTCDATNQYHGKALITSLNVTADNGEKATYTVSFKGCGNLQKMGKGIEKAATAPMNLAQGSKAVETATVETATAKK
ncbi:MAG: phage tail protein [Muribaculaceae bacterium]|nr:phage tail protein [Muribaculaceae bacterium]